MKQYARAKNILIIILLILLAFSILFIFLDYAPIKNKIPTFSKETTNIIETKGEPKTLSCNRTTRLENKQQYDRALSLIYQRISEGIGTKYKYFPVELTNCIKIIEEIDKSTDIEGYFILNNEDIKSNYYPIIVNSRYQEADDVVIALLLIHEINHVQQYINTQNGNEHLSCIEREIESFYAQQDFWPLLNSEEGQSILSRYHSDESLHPQIIILFTMLNSFSESKCDFWDFKCSESYLRTKLEKIIRNDSYYKKQCNLK